MNITYQEVKPSAALQPYVDAYWLQSFSGEPNEMSPDQFCIPFGTAELIITLDDGSCEIKGDGQWYELPNICVCGMYQEKVIWRAGGKTRKFGVRLKPETFPMLFKESSAVLHSNFTLLENMVGNEAGLLAEKLVETPDLPTIIKHTEAFLLAQLRRQKEAHNYVVEAAKLIRSAKGGMSVEEISKSVYVSVRQLQRSFQKEIGMSPKTYQRIIRFRNAYRDMQKLQQIGGWAGLSYGLGYADQAHFIREFKEFSGFIPSDLLANRTHIHGLAETAHFSAPYA